MLGRTPPQPAFGAPPCRTGGDADEHLWAYNAPGHAPAAKAFAWSVLVGASAVRTLHVIDPIVCEAYQDQAAPSHGGPFWLPIRSRRSRSLQGRCRRARLWHSDRRRFVSCVGRLDARKGVDLLVRAFLDAPTHATDRLLLMGKVMPEVGDPSPQMPRLR